MASNLNRAGLITESSTLFPDNNTQEISPQDLRDWIADGTTSFVTQKDKSTLENAIYENYSTPLAAGSTVDLSTATGNFVHITGAATITSFGTLTAGARFVLVFDGICLLTYNATSLIIPGSANKTTAAGDACLIISEGSGNWRIVGYFAISGSGGGGGTPGGLDTQIQYNNGGAFGGVSDLVWDDGTNTLTIKNPRIGQSTGNGHFHMHTINASAPSGVTDYITVYADKSPKQIGARFETDGYTSAIQFGATADRTYSLPDATGNVLVDTVIPSLNNGTSAGEIRLKEATGSGSNYVAIKAPTTLAADYSLTLPDALGGAGNYLSTDAFGVLSWQSFGSTSYKAYRQIGKSTGVTNTNVQTPVVVVEIPANSFKAGECFQISAYYSKEGTTIRTYQLGIYFNTVNNLTGSPVFVADVRPGATIISANVVRELAILSASGASNNVVYTTGTGGQGAFSPYAGSSQQFSFPSIDWTVTQYLIVGLSQTGTPLNATETGYSYGISIVTR